MRLDIDARFVPFAVIIWINSVLIITKHLEVVIFLLFLLVILTFFTRINYLYTLAAFVTIISSLAHISKEKIIELTPGVPVVAYVKVISDVRNNAGKNIGIFRQEDTFSVVGKSFRIEETGLKQNKGFTYKSKIKLDFNEINRDIEFGTKLKAATLFLLNNMKSS